MLSTTHHPDTLTFRHVPSKYTHILSHTQPRRTPPSSRYTHSHPNIPTLTPTQLNPNTYTPSRYTHTLLLPNTSVLSDPHHTQKHLLSLTHTHNPDPPPPLNHHHLEYSQSIHTMQLHPYSLNTPPHTIHSTLQLYTHSHTPPSSPRCAQILSLTHIHHLDILHHTLPLPRYTCALTHLHTIQVCSHLNAPILLYPYSLIHILYPEIPTSSYTYNTDISTYTSFRYSHSLASSRYIHPHIPHKYTHPHTCSHPATPNLLLI